MTTKVKIIISSIVILLCLGGGFLLGRFTIKIPEPEIITEFIQIKPVEGEVTPPYEVIVEKPVDTLSLFEYCLKNELYAYLIPTVEKEKIVYQSVDTNAIIKDFIVKNKYTVKLFDIDTVGLLTVYPEVQYNQLQSIRYNFVPIMKTTTEIYTKEPMFEPFISAGVGFNNALIQIGAFNRTGRAAAVQYERLMQVPEGFNPNLVSLIVTKKF